MIEWGAKSQPILWKVRIAKQPEKRNLKIILKDTRYKV